MARHRAIIVGAGRVGSGFNWISTPYIYTHADAYLALRDRVELLGFVEPNLERAEAAKKKYGLSVWTEVPKVSFDIASVCTPPPERATIFDQLIEAGVNGIWCEKPYGMKAVPPVLTQVNYIRRGDLSHSGLKWIGKGHLTVWAKKDIHTVCHFCDLARYWGLGKDQLTYHEFNGPNSYEWELQSATPLNPNTKIRFEGGGLSGGFMERMLENLMDSMEGKSVLISSAETAIESEKWADELLKHRE